MTNEDYIEALFAKYTVEPEITGTRPAPPPEFRASGERYHELRAELATLKAKAALAEEMARLLDCGEGDVATTINQNRAADWVNRYNAVTPAAPLG